MKAEKKPSSRANKAQRRAQQAEFNRQLWQDAYVSLYSPAHPTYSHLYSEGPRETNYFLETRAASAVPLKSEFKPPPILLSRKGPPTPPGTSTSLASGVNNLSLRDDSSSDDDSAKKAPQLTAEERKAQATKDRQDRQRKYEERREQLFGPTSGASSPNDVTPPVSRSGTPSRGRGGRGRGGGNAASSRSHQQQQQQTVSGGRDKEQTSGGSRREIYDPTYSPKPDSVYLQRKEKGVERNDLPATISPIRAPRNPDGSGRGGFGFGARGAKVS